MIRGALSLLAALVFLAVLSGCGAGSGGGGSSSAGTSGAQAEVGGGRLLGSPSLGRRDAPVTIVEYADFQCPYCGRFARQVEPRIVARYVRSGEVRLVWRDFPYLGQESVNAALAARAAQAQGKFWEYHDLLYENQGRPNSGAFSDAKLISLARQAHLDVGKFRSDFEGAKYAGAVKRDFARGQSLGISGTPTFFINGRRLVGAQPYQVFVRAIRQASRESGR
ncbi:DsbA family protein [Rubrobacter naiadicus]|uniref:DsbA family protein n=1 Tax=Rubrobacter naiadicus TaxID=1392641 RepID=UPI0023605008|nr:thioredoxin domain-containing protein [Rubrobacter naiadicus]